MRESALNATSFVEPRNFSMVFARVQDDYGSCCLRSLHRHLVSLCEDGEVIRMDFKTRSGNQSSGQLSAYLRAGSRLVADPDFVYEQILDLRAEQTSYVKREYRSRKYGHPALPEIEERAA